jgi:hypothetical protein
MSRAETVYPPGSPEFKVVSRSYSWKKERQYNDKKDK